VSYAIFVDEVPFPTPILGIGEISLDDFIEAVQGTAQAHAADSPEEFLTRLRQHSYPGTDPDGLTFREIAFDHLLPDAPFRLAGGTRRLLDLTILEPIFFGRLTMRAPENPTPGRPLDNPSPYFYDTTAAKVDLGHLLLTLDALLHPRADTPYADFGIPAIDPASWVADLGIAAVWTERDGEPGAPIRLPHLADRTINFDGYFLMSAPEPDLLGDIDGFNVAAGWLHGASLSSALISYYVDGDEGPGLYRQRFRMFLSRLFGTTKPNAEQLAQGVTDWTSRVDRFNELFSLGATDAFLTLTSPPPRQWQFSPDAIARFFQWLLDQRDIETSRFD
jgi:hypothetical protein